MKEVPIYNLNILLPLNTLRVKKLFCCCPFHSNGLLLANSFKTGSPLLTTQNLSFKNVRYWVKLAQRKVPILFKASFSINATLFQDKGTGSPVKSHLATKNRQRSIFCPNSLYKSTKS